MGLDIRGIASGIGRQLVESLDTGHQIREQLPPAAFAAGAALDDFAAGAAGSLSEAFASRTGLATALHPLAVRSARTEAAPSDKAFDGHFVGAGGQTFDAATPLAEIPAVTPTGGARNDETLIYVNGIQTDVAGQANSLQAIADTTGSRVVGVHNATGTFVGDVLQSLGDKLDIGANPAVDTLAETVYGELAAGREVHLMAHSQGAIITSRALEDVRNRLMVEDGLGRGEAEALMRNVKVETFGGAARRYPDGPQYVHHVNRNDGVPQAFGLRSWLNPFADPGRDAATHYFRAGKPLVSHGFEEFYLPRRMDFEAARR